MDHMSGAEAAEKIKALAEAARMCLMMTMLDKRPCSVRPMAIQKVDANGSIYFMSRANSDKNAELKHNNEMHLTFSNDAKSEYLSLYGHAIVYRDQKEIDEMYSVFVNTWFDGKDDPNISIIRFDPENGHYWDTKNGKIVALAGMVVGAITGKETDNSLEGDLRIP
jgi:general stress protein 26